MNTMSLQSPRGFKKSLIVLAIASIEAATLTSAFAAETPTPRISGIAGGSTIAIGTCPQLDANAICSLTWNGKQFIDDYDHGRQLQSALTLDDAEECSNPTEAGSSLDGPSIFNSNKNPSTSVSVNLAASGNVMTSRTRMAYWKTYNGQTLSNHYLDKKVTIGALGLPNVIEYLTTFSFPANEPHSTLKWNGSSCVADSSTASTHTSAKFEVLTGYMPLEFSTFRTIDVVTGATYSLAATPPGEQGLPLIFSDASNNYAMGIYSPRPAGQTLTSLGYGRWLFSGNSVSKWNTVYRVQNPTGSHSFRSYVVVGKLADVKASMKALSRLVPSDQGGVYTSSRSNFTVSNSSGSKFSVRNNTSGVTVIFDSTTVPTLKFSDKMTALNLNGNSGQLARLYASAFNRFPDQVGLGFFNNAMEQGSTLESVASQFIASPEFTSLWGSNLSNDAFVKLVYKNSLFRTPDSTGLTFWTNALATGSSRAAVMVAISQSDESKTAYPAHYNVTQGIDYIPYQ